MTPRSTHLPFCSMTLHFVYRFWETSGLNISYLRYEYYPKFENIKLLFDFGFKFFLILVKKVPDI